MCSGFERSTMSYLRSVDSGLSRLLGRVNAQHLRCRRLGRPPELRQSHRHNQQLAGAGARARVLRVQRRQRSSTPCGKSPGTLRRGTHEADCQAFHPKGI